MTDMLVRLYDMPPARDESGLTQNGVLIKRAMAMDISPILAFVKEHFSQNWVDECAYALYNDPISCFIAVKDRQVIGFACYDVAARGFFGPTGVLASQRGQGVGAALLFRCMDAMREQRYAYAIIGWVGDAAGFYAKTVGAAVIEGAAPDRSVFQNRIEGQPPQAGL